MIGSLLTRGLLLIFGYAYPAYECYKTVELNKPDIGQLQFWCQYWILVAGLTVCERIGDTFIGWLPMYGEAKLAFFIYLWFPKTKGTTYVYTSFFRPYVAKHETEIDRNLLELKTRAGDMAVLYWQKAASYGQTRIFEILQYIASQSSSRRPTQPQQQVNRTPKPGVALNDKSVVASEDGQKPSSPETSTASSSENQESAAEEVGPSGGSKPALTAPPPATAMNELKKETTPTPLLAESSKSSASTGQQVMQIDENNKPHSQDVISQEGTRVTRPTRLRKTRSANTRMKE